jgi:hypothetical protein
VSYFLEAFIVVLLLSGFLLAVDEFSIGSLMKPTANPNWLQRDADVPRLIWSPRASPPTFITSCKLMTVTDCRTDYVILRRRVASRKSRPIASFV